MTDAFSYACRDCGDIQACPVNVTGESKNEVWQPMAHHARIAHSENPESWDRQIRDQFDM